MTVPTLDRDTMVGVVGAGAMGSGIAQVALVRGHRVLLADARPDAAAAADEGIRRALAARLAAMPTRGLGLTKRGLNAGLGSTLDAQLAAEEGLQREAGRTADYAEGVRAFVEKRRPAFVGR